MYSFGGGVEYCKINECLHLFDKLTASYTKVVENQIKNRQ